MTKILEWIAKKVGFFGVLFSPLLAFVAAVATFIDQITLGIIYLNTQLTNLLPTINGGIAALEPWFVKANTFFPVTEAFAMVLALITLRSVAATIRTTKAFISTLA